ncbi:FAD-binding protein, partial [Acinetobacter baumannii]
TSTANRAMIGGMLGNNSCGLHSIVWGSFRDHIQEVKALLSDGTEVLFTAENILSEQENTLKQRIYNGIYAMLCDEKNKNI